MQTNMVHVHSPVLTLQAGFAHAIQINLNVIFDIHSSVHNPAHGPVHSPDHGRESNFYSIHEHNRITAPTSLRL